jgi:AraC family transcriptional regulator
MNAPADSVPVTFGSPRALVTEVDGFVVSDLRFEAGLDLPRHTHDRATVAVLLAGSMEQRDGSGRSTDCRGGSVLVEPAGDLHANRFDSAGACVLVVQPDPGGREILAPFLPVLERRTHLHDIEVAALARRLTYEMRTPDDLTPLSVTGLVLELLARAARLAAPRVGRRPPPWLATARELLHDRFDEPLRVGEVAAAAGVHPVHLARVFRAYYGLSVSAYLRGLRVDWAAQRLATTDEPIAQIADRAGFNDQSHLTRSMQARLGATPLEWRRSARRGPSVPPEMIR